MKTSKILTSTFVLSLLFIGREVHSQEQQQCNDILDENAQVYRESNVITWQSSDPLLDFPEGLFGNDFFNSDLQWKGQGKTWENSRAMVWEWDGKPEGQSGNWTVVKNCSSTDNAQNTTTSCPECQECPTIEDQECPTCIKEECNCPNKTIPKPDPSTSQQVCPSPNLNATWALLDLPEYHHFYFNNVKYTYRLFKNGTILDQDNRVVTQYGDVSYLANYTSKLYGTTTPQHCPTESVQEVTYTLFSIKRVFQIYTNGTVKEGKNIICTSGGEPCLNEFIKTLHFQKVIVTLAQTNYTFHVYNNGTVYHSDGTLLCTAGGQKCIEDWVTQQTPQYTTQSVVYNNITYTFYIYNNGTVSRSNGTLICTTGGSQCLNDWIKNQSTQVSKTTYTAVINGVSQSFTIFTANGTVVNDQGKTICQTGGQLCLEAWIETQTYHTCTQTHNNVTYSFLIYENGTVTYTNNTVICQADGYTCLESWINSLIAKYTTHTYIINNVPYTFYVYTNRTVTHQNGTILTFNGGITYLNHWVQNYINAFLTPKPVLPQYTIYNSTINGVIFTFNVYTNGTVINNNDGKKICTSLGKTCLQNWINGQSYTQYLYTLNNINYTFNIFQNGTVTHSNGTVLCKTGGQKCLTDWSNARVPDFSYQSVTIDNVTYNFTVYNNGTVVHPNGTVIIQDGGLQALTTWVQTNIVDALKTTIYTVTISGQQYNYTIYSSNGTVFDNSGKVICKSGGQTCLEAWLQTQSYTTYTYTINNLTQDYNIYQNGSVVCSNGTFVCQTGGKQCLDDWIQTFTFTTYTLTLNNVTQSYQIYQNGTVTNANGSVICKTGGQACLEKSLIPDYTQYTYTINNVSTQYNVYTNGTVKDTKGTLICQTGGKVCLDNWISSLTFNTYSITKNNATINYQIYLNGTVIDNTGTVICKTGGQGCLESYLYNFTTTTYTYTINNTTSNFTVYKNGTVISSNGTVICQTGGKQCLDTLQLSLLYTVYTYTIKGTSSNYIVYQNGTVTDTKGTIVCKTGGIQCLNSLLTTITYTTFTYTVNNISTNYDVYSNGTVFSSKGVVICQTGGQKCLENWLQQSLFTTYTYTINNVAQNYNVYQNGTVISGADGTVICKEGGQKCLETFLQTLTYTTYTYTVNNVSTPYNVYQNGTVTSSSGAVLCQTGGQKCLENLLQALSYTTYTYTINNVSSNYNIYQNGTVVSSNGSAICQTGGQKCLEQYVQNIVDSLSVTVVSLEVAGKLTNFTITGAGKVTHENGTVICQTGGKTCLDTWAASQLTQIVQYTFNDKAQKFILYLNTGKVTTLTGEVLFETGGVAKLQEWIKGQVSASNTVSYDVNGVETEFQIYDNGTVTTKNGTLLSQTGGQEWLEEYIIELLSADESTDVIYQINGVSQQFSIHTQSGEVTDSTGKVICETGGQDCLEKWVKTQLATVYTYTINGIDTNYTVYQESGKIVHQNGTVLFQSGGEAQLKTYIENLLKTLQITEVNFEMNNINYTFLINGNGKVTNKKSGVSITETGGQAFLKEWIKKNTLKSTVVTMQIGGDDHDFTIYEDGKVYDAADKLICKTGGEECLEDYVLEMMPTEEVLEIHYDINGEDYLFTIDSESGLVFDTNNNIICETGGQSCLDKYVESITFTVHTVNDIDYRIYRNGTVFDSKGTKTICVSGGEDCLLTALGLSGAQINKLPSTGKLGGFFETDSQEVKGNSRSWIVLALSLICIALAALYFYKRNQIDVKGKEEGLYLGNNEIKQSLLQ